MPRKQILFLDKDETLYGKYLNAFDKETGPTKLYDGVEEFLEEQAAFRTCIIATLAGNAGKSTLKDIESHYAAYYGRNQFSDLGPGFERGHGYYIAQNGLLRRVDDDYVSPPKYKTSPRSHFVPHAELIHNETGQPFDVQTQYKNPHLPPGMTEVKDLHLAKRLYAPNHYQDYISVMIGNVEDIRAVASDPDTPLIMVEQPIDNNYSLYDRSNKYINSWLLRQNARLLLQKLFSGPDSPGKIFDELYAVGIATANMDTRYLDTTVIAEVEGIRFRFGRKILTVPTGQTISRVIEEQFEGHREKKSSY